MLTKKIIPCLDVKDGRVVKGISFVHMQDTGDPVEFATLYEREGADELVFLDISATLEGRKTMIQIVQSITEAISIPLTVGGGIACIEDMEKILKAGADKVSLNTAAVLNPVLIEKGAKEFGSKSLVVAIDAKYNPQLDLWEVYTHGGTKNTGLNVLVWAQEVANLGAGEILLTSIDYDGQKQGYDIDLTKAVCDLVSIPVIASGGAGSKEDILEVFEKANAAAALAASIFHFKETSVREIKGYLQDKGVLIS